MNWWSTRILPADEATASILATLRRAAPRRPDLH
jgi:hypothetical protein